MSKIKLYDHMESQNGYKVRLALSNLKIDYEWIQIDLIQGEQKKDWFIKLNPNGKVPTLVDGDLAVWESNAILLYIGNKFSPNNLIPKNINKLTMMYEWLMLEATTISRHLSGARFLTRFIAPDKVNKDELSKYKKDSRRILKIVDEHLNKHSFFAEDYSLADIACYGQIYTATEGGIDLSEFRFIQTWQKRVETQPGYVEMKPKVAVKN